MKGWDKSWTGAVGGDVFFWGKIYAQRLEFYAQ